MLSAIALMTYFLVNNNMGYREYSKITKHQSVQEVVSILGKPDSVIKAPTPYSYPRSPNYVVWDENINYEYVYNQADSFVNVSIHIGFNKHHQVVMKLMND